MKAITIFIVLLAVLLVTVFLSFTSIEKSENTRLKNSSVVSTSSAINFQNMQEAYRGESISGEKYEAFSKKAEEEGYPEIALLFKATSASGKIHANYIKTVLVESGLKVPVIKTDFSIKTTKENLEDAINEEEFEVKSVYPEYIASANNAGNNSALLSLNYVYKTEQKLKPFYQKALEALKSNAVESLPKVYYVCPECGYAYENAYPKRCGISPVIGEKFIKFSSLNI